MIQLIIAIVATIVFTVADALSDAQAIKVGRSGENAISHGWQTARQGIFLLLATLYGGWQSAIILGAVFWILHDGLINRYALDKSFAYVGSTAWLDKLFQRLPAPQVMMLVAKGLVLAGGVWLLTTYNPKVVQEVQNIIVRDSSVLEIRVKSVEPVEVDSVILKKDSLIIK